MAHYTSFDSVVWYCRVADVELCEAFSLFDKDGDGQITVDEVAQTMTSLGIDVRLSDIKVMVDQVDTDGQSAHILSFSVYVLPAYFPPSLQVRPGHQGRIFVDCCGSFLCPSCRPTSSVS